jgi:hypothetical protein
VAYPRSVAATWAFLPNLSTVTDRLSSVTWIRPEPGTGTRHSNGSRLSEVFSAEIETNPLVDRL